MTALASLVAPAPAAPSVPVSAVPTAPVPSVLSVPFYFIPFFFFFFFFLSSLVFHFPFIAGSLPTIPSQSEAGSSSYVAIPDDAASFFVRFDQPEVNDLGPAEFWASGPPYVDFNGFRVPEGCVSHLVMIYSSHGNFMQGFRLGRSAREHFLKMLGCMLNDIEHNFIDTVSAERILQWRAAVQELISVGFAVEFILEDRKSVV